MWKKVTVIFDEFNPTAETLLDPERCTVSGDSVESVEGIEISELDCSEVLPWKSKSPNPTADAATNRIRVSKMGRIV